MKKTRTYSIKPELYKLPAVGSWAHLGTEYKASLKRDMSNPIVYSYTEDAITKKELSFNIDVDEDTVIYTTTNIKITDGVTPKWCGESGIGILTTRKEIATTNGIIVTPKISIDELYVDGGFTVTGGDFIRYDGVGDHESTTYLIENEITGEVIIHRKKDRDNLKKFKFPMGILKAGNIYRISMMYHDTLNGSSNYGSIIYTLGYSVDSIFPMEEIEIEYGNYKNIVAKNLEWLPGFKVNMELFADVKNMKDIEYTKAVVTADGNYLITPDGSYVLVNSESDNSVLSINGRLINVIDYDNGFKLTSTDFEVGELMMGRINIYNDDISIVKSVKIFISKFVRDSIHDIDTDIVFNGKLSEITTSDMGLSRGMYEENIDGYIHKLKYNTWDLYKYKVDDTSKIGKGEYCCSIKTDELAFGDANIHMEHSVLENPYGGLIVFSSENLNTVAANTIDEKHARIKFIDIDNNGDYTITSEIKSTLMFTGIHSGSGYYVVDQYLYFIPIANYTSTTATTYTGTGISSSLYRLDMKNHTLEKLVTISSAIFTTATDFYAHKLIVSNGKAYIIDPKTSAYSNVYVYDLVTKTGSLIDNHLLPCYLNTNNSASIYLSKFFTQMKNGKQVMIQLKSGFNNFMIYEISGINFITTTILYDGTTKAINNVTDISTIIKLRNGGLVFGSLENPSKLYLLN